MSLKVKLISCISLFMLMLGVLIIGVFAATQQQLTMQGSVSFNVPDKSLYVKDVRIKQDMASEPESIDSFMPGYINGEFNLDLTGLTEENTYGSFTLYFDMINTTDIFWQITEVDLGSLVSDGVSEEHGGYVEVGAGEDTIINNSTKPDGTLTLTIMAPNADADNPVVLDGIVITIDEYIPQEITDFTFNNLSDSTGELVSYNGTETEVVIPNSYSIYQGKFVEGSKYTVTSIAAGDSETTFSSTVFDASITKVTLPEGLINIGEYAFASLNLTGTITIPSTVETIGDSAFINCFELKGVNLRNCTNLKTIDDYAFYLCYNTTGELYIPASVTSIGLRAFSYTGFTSINVDANNQYFSSENRALYNKDKTTLICGSDCWCVATKTKNKKISYKLRDFFNWREKFYKKEF